MVFCMSEMLVGDTVLRTLWFWFKISYILTLANKRSFKKLYPKLAFQSKKSFLKSLERLELYSYIISLPKTTFLGRYDVTIKPALCIKLLVLSTKAFSNLLFTIS